MLPTFNIGIEEEYQTIDPETRDLRSHIGTELLPEGKRQLQESVKAEMHQSVVEVGTGICNTVREAREQLYELRQTIIRLANSQGLKVAAAGTHPFANWREQEIYPDARYDTIVDDLQQVARENLIFGLHVHIGIPDKETRIRILNSVRYFLPHILALSTNSPFWLGYDTGFKSYRCKVFDKFPRTNIPDAFSSWSEFEGYVDLLIKTGCIDNAKKSLEFFGSIKSVYNDASPKFVGDKCKLRHQLNAANILIRSCSVKISDHTIMQLQVHDKFF